MYSKNLFLKIFVALFAISGSLSAQIDPDLKKRVDEDTRLQDVMSRAETLIQTGLNAGSGYAEVWIRDLNTFIEPACKVVDTNKIRDALLVFFKFQGDDGNIVDGYVTRTDDKISYDFRYSDLAPEFKAHKNTVETDQESSLIQAIAKYVRTTGDKSILQEQIAGRSVEKRMNDALQFLLNERFNMEYGLIWGATTADWGDVQPEHNWGVALDNNSHLCIDIYDNAMFAIAIRDFISLIDDTKNKIYWENVHANITLNVRKHLWDSSKQKFIPHIYLNGSPFPANFDESAVYYHGGTAIAIEADMLSKDEILASYRQMQRNVAAAGANSIGLTVYPPYPEGFFLNPSMKPYGYQNGGDWCWFGARMVQQLIAYGFYNEAYEALSPMIDRVIEHNGFYEWWTLEGKPKGSGMFRGSAGTIWKAIKMMQEKSAIPR
jgi:hypothetical protein